MLDIAIKYYVIKGNLIRPFLILIQHNFIFSKLPTSEARRGTAEQ